MKLSLFRKLFSTIIYMVLIFVNIRFVLMGIETTIASLKKWEFVSPTENPYIYYVGVSVFMIIEAVVWYWSCRKGIHDNERISLVFISLMPCLMPLTMLVSIISVIFTVSLNIILMCASITHSKDKRSHT